MKGTELYRVLQRIGATHLHHANSIITSSTFLEQGGLLSRSFVQRNKLAQTEQPMSDDIDKKYKIWDSIFLDHVDIHERGGKKKGPNHYGPALFIFELDVLLHLPRGTEIGVTKLNPIHWGRLDYSDRWFQSPEEVASVVRYGNFDNMLVIQIPTGKLLFRDKQVNILLDDPQQRLNSGSDAYTHAKGRLKAAGAIGGVSTMVRKRTCQSGCICQKAYAKYPSDQLEDFFG